MGTKLKLDKAKNSDVLLHSKKIIDDENVLCIFKYKLEEKDLVCLCHEKNDKH